MSWQDDLQKLLLGSMTIRIVAGTTVIASMVLLLWAAVQLPILIVVGVVIAILIATAWKEPGK